MNGKSLLGLARAIGVGAALLGTAAIASSTGPGADLSEPRYLDNSGGDDWPGPGRTYGEQHYSPLAAINQETVADLGLAWAIDLQPGYTVTQPIAVDGILYFTTGLGILHAVDGATGKPLWVYDPEVWKSEVERIRNVWGSRGISWWNGDIFMGTLGGRLIAVNASTGHPKWSVQTIEPGDKRYISGAPRAFAGKVIVGHGGADAAAVRGYVTAYDAATGRQLWRFHTVPGNPAAGFENDAMAMAAKTWHGDWWKFGGGGTVWNAISYDPETATVFIGTGNGAPWSYKVRSQGKGDNLFLSSIIALNAETGAYKWHYQTNPGETWDYNAAMDMQFAELTVGGNKRKVLITAPKNGFLYVIDRTDGTLLSAEPYTKVTWASGIDLATGRPIDTPNNRFESGPFLMAPSPAGSHSWLPMAFSPQTGLVYIPIIEMEMEMYDAFTDPEEWQRPSFHAVNGGVAIGNNESAGTSALIAIDPVTQKEAWRVPTPTVANGGVMATAGGVVFQGAFDNAFSAYDARSGKRLWKFDTRAPTLAPPITYMAGGHQYVTVITGAGGSLVLNGEAFQEHAVGYYQQPRRVLTFRLGAEAILPAAPAYRFQPIEDANYVSQPASEERGFAIYSQTCIMCHGREAVAFGGSAPDLRESPAILSPEAFVAIVRDGALRRQGMPPFADLTDDLIEDVRQYLRMRVRQHGKKVDSDDRHRSE